MEGKVYEVHTPGNSALFYEEPDAFDCVVLLADLQGMNVSWFDIERNLKKNGRFDFGSCYIRMKCAEVENER